MRPPGWSPFQFTVLTGEKLLGDFRPVCQVDRPLGGAQTQVRKPRASPVSVVKLRCQGSSGRLLPPRPRARAPGGPRKSVLSSSQRNAGWRRFPDHISAGHILVAVCSVFQRVGEVSLREGHSLFLLISTKALKILREIKM